MANTLDKVETMIDFIFLGSKITAGSDCIHIIKKQHTKKQRHHFANKGSSHQSYGFSSRYVPMRELDHKEGWAPNNSFFQTLVLQKTLDSPLNSMEIKPVNPNVNQPWIINYWKDWCWSWSSNTLPTWYKEASHWKRPWCWEVVKAKRKEGVNGWDD